MPVQRINRKIVEDFLSIQKQLPQIAEHYGISHKYIYTNAGFSKATYFRKLKTHSFDGEEMLRIADVINR